jgi:hypothetical protein
MLWSCRGVWTKAGVNSPFVPTLPAALFVSDFVTAAVLFARFSLLRQWARLGDRQR